PRAFIGAGRMQDKKLGRWVVRVALAIGVGVAVLGGLVAANAGTVSAGGVGGLPVVPVPVGPCVQGAPLNHTDAGVWGWLVADRPPPLSDLEAAWHALRCRSGGLSGMPGSSPAPWR